MIKKMFPGLRFGVAAVSAWLLMSTVAVGRVKAQSLTILHHFEYSVEDSDGYASYAGLIRDAAGNFYGTASGGGFGGGGIVFRLDPSGNNYTVLHYFDDGTVANDGSFPTARLTLDSSGHLYGTTIYGGSAGGGTVFKLDTSGNNYTVLYSFPGWLDDTSTGTVPWAGLTLDSSGHLYGTARDGGSNDGGVVFKLDSSGGNYTVLHTFSDDGRKRRMEPVGWLDP